MKYTSTYHDTNANIVADNITANTGNIDVLTTSKINTKVGIGMDNPVANVGIKSNLEIEGPTSDYYIGVQDGNGRIQHKWNATIGTSEKYLVSNEPAYFLNQTVIGDPYYRIQYAPRGTAGQRITWNTHLSIKQNGNIGIGTTNPAQKLHVNGYVKAKGYFNFTGLHSCPTNDNRVLLKPGHIMVSTGDIEDDGEEMPYVTMSSKINMKNVLGVVANINGDRAELQSLGEGKVMVITDPLNIIKNGDYITTSNLKGVGKKQIDDIYYNYTVAKALEDANFTEEIEHNGKIYKMGLVKCVFLCG